MPHPPAAHVIEIAGLQKDYRGLRPLRIRSLAVRAGEQVAIDGLDAPAAEVLVNLITAAALPDEGEVRIFGHSTRDVSIPGDWLALLDRFGIVTPRAVLLEGLSVIQNLALPLTVEIDPLSPETAERARRLGSDAGLSAELYDRPLSQVSAEQRVRVQLGRAIALDPVLLLLEHPTASLSGAAIERLGADLAELARRRCLTLLALTNDGAFARAVADRVLALRPATGELSAPSWWRR